MYTRYICTLIRVCLCLDHIFDILIMFMQESPNFLKKTVSMKSFVFQAFKTKGTQPSLCLKESPPPCYLHTGLLLHYSQQRVDEASLGIHQQKNG